MEEDTLNVQVDDILNSINALYDTESAEPSEDADTSYAMYSLEMLEKQGYADTQIEEITLGVSHHLPVWRYAKEYYNWRQMREIRLGLLSGLDTGLYDNALFSAEQMREIRLGLEEHLDVSSYANLILSTGDMAAARKSLLSDVYREHPGGHARELEDDDSGVKIRISDDCMEAFATLPDGHEITANELNRILKRNQIIFGVSWRYLKEAEASEGGTEIKVAEGTRASKGKDGRYEYFFNPLLPDEPRVKGDGSVDYTKVVVADKRNEGDVLAKYYPAEQGTDGETVTGIVIKGEFGTQQPALRGQGIRYDEKNHLYRASESGFVLLDEREHTLNVWNVYVVNGDVNRYNGHITYNGVIHICGSVSDMAEIQATGNVIVDGYVEAAHIKAGENIILRGGMNGCGRGVLEAGGKVAGKFFESAAIYAGGDVEGNYFMNCNVVTDHSVIAKGSKSKIMGGSIRAGYSVESSSILDVGKAVTLIDVGDPVWLGNRLRQVREKLAKVQEELQQLREGSEKMRDVLGEEAVEQNALFHKVCIAIHMKEEEESALWAEQEYHVQVSRRAQSAYIKVYSQIQSGVTLVLGGKTVKTENTRQGTVIFKREET